MITGNINLMALTNAFTEVRKSASGTDIECITIPLAVNHLKKDEYGVKVAFVAWDKPNLKGNATHIVNQSLPEAVTAALKAESKYPPTLGNLWEKQQAAAATGAVVPEQMPQGGGNLPF